MAPIVTSFSPTSGPNLTGTLITIIGSNFTGVTDVQIGGYSIGFDIISDTEIHANVPGFISDDVVYVQVFSDLGFSDFGSGGPFTFGSGSPPPPPLADCITLSFPGFLADGVTSDANMIVYTVQALDGWFDSAPVRSGTLEANPRGETVTVAHELARPVDAQIVATVDPLFDTILRNALCFTAIRTIKTAFRAIYVPVLMDVIDPSGQERTMLARRVGPIKSQIIGEGAAVRFNIPMLGENPVLVTV